MSSRTRRDLLVLLVAFAVTLPLVTARIYASDEVQYFAYLRSLWFDRDVSFENEYQHFYDSNPSMRNALFHETFLERFTEATGLRVNFATGGAALLWSPFYAAADAWVALKQGGGPDAPARDGYSQPYVSAVAYGSAFYAWLAVVLGWSMARRLVGDTPALVAALAVWFGTPLFFYMYIAPPMSHACSAFAVALFLWTWLRVREHWSVGGCVALGALAALMATVREQDVFIAIGPGLDFLWTQFQPQARRDGPIALATRVVAAGAAFLLAYAPQLWAYVVLNGRFGPSRLVARKMTWTAPHALGVLASPEHGLLFWTPLVALSLAGLVWAIWRSPVRPVAAALLIAVASQVYIAGSVESWTVAGAFGQRRFVGLTALLIAGLALLLARTLVTRRFAVATALVLCVWWNLGLTLQFGAGLMDRQRLDLPLNAWQTYVTIPARLPDLAYRYVFARSSFYRPAAAPEPRPEP